MLPIDPKVEVKADLDPVLKAAPSSIRFIYDLLLGDRHNAVQRRRRLSEAQVDLEIKKIQEGSLTYDHTSGELLALESSALSSLAVHIADEEARNILACGVKASEFVAEDASGESVSSAFLNRWRSEARLVSEQELQNVWGRILAEEVNQPNSVSLRTLDVIKNLTQPEAMLFRKACGFVVADGFVVEGAVIDDGRLTKEEFKLLLDAGLISSYSEWMKTTKKWPSTSVTTRENITFNARYVQIYDNFVYLDTAKVPEYSDDMIPEAVYWELTSAAKQLYRMLIKDMDVDLRPVVSLLLEKRESLRSHVWAGKYANSLSGHIDSDTFRPLYL